MARPRKQTYTLKRYLDDIKEGYVSNDADTQRNPAWKTIIDGLAVTVLTDDYIPSIILAEEDSGQMHIVDGGSRTAALNMIIYGNHTIKRTLKNSVIKYKSMKKNEDGDVIWEDAEFDIRGKTFEQFPKELKKKFEEYQIETVVHEHCTKEKIAMYIERYNTHSAMNADQKMLVQIPVFANKIRKIMKQQFFVNCNDISDTEKDKGKLERTIIESVMCMFHLNKWNKTGNKIASYLNENATEDEFNKLSDNLHKLENIITDETKGVFTSKDIFVWMTLFEKFTTLGLDDSKFADFLKAFVGGLRNKKIDGKLFDTVDTTGSTKDKAIIIDKLHILETLMNEFLHIKEEEIDSISTEDFISDVVNIPVEDVKEDLSLYEESLLDLQNNTIRDGSKLLEVKNHLSMLAIMAYSYKNDVDIEEFMEDYASKNNMYMLDQRQNYIHMVQALRQFQKGMFK